MPATLCVVTLIVAIVAWMPVSAAARQPALWGDLGSGPFAVGYRTLFVRDPTRGAVVDLESTRKPVTGSRGRQMQINIWYPARPSARPPLTFGHYVALLARYLDFRPMTPARTAFASDRFLEQPVALGGDAADLRRRLPRLLALETAAVEDAAPARGHYPVLIWPEYRSPATNFVLAEFLASHGFVVAAFALKGTYDEGFSAGLADLETTVADIRFTLGVVRGLPAVDAERVALAGVGISASACLALQMRDPLIGAVVSLDGGIPTPFEDRMLKHTPYFDATAVRVPLLAVYAPHPDVDPAILDQYRYSARTIVRFPAMTEFHFLTYGMLERFAPRVVGEPPGDTKTSFEWACRYVLRFLDASLRGNRESIAFLSAAPEANGAPPGVVEVSVKAALQAPPTTTELKALVRARGAAGVREAYARLRVADPQPFGHQVFVDLANWLGEGRDPDWRVRRELAELRAEAFPDSSRARFSLANALERTGARDEARRQFERALEALASDRDPELDDALRGRISDGARAGIERLKR